MRPRSSPCLGLQLALAAHAQAFVYWTEPGDTHAIGRANTDGTLADPEFIEIPKRHPYGLAVDGGHIYWVDHAADAIGRADLDGGGVEEAFCMQAGHRAMPAQSVTTAVGLHIGSNS